MATMKAVLFEEWGGPLTVREVEVPEPAENEVRISVRACGITRTVENIVHGGLSEDSSVLPRIPGHESSGVIDAVGDNVETVDVGDRVVAYFYLICGYCDACRRGDTSLCMNFNGWLGVQRDGAYAEKMVLPERNVLPIPDELSFHGAVIAADGLATPLHVCSRAEISDADTVLILGAAGRVGIHMAQAARARGANVLGAEITDERLDHINEHTDDGVIPIDARNDDLVGYFKDESPHTDGPTVVVDTTGHTETMRAAWKSMDKGGRMVTLITHHEQALEIPLRDYVSREGSLLGSRYARKDEVVRASRMIADGRVKAVVNSTVGIDEVSDIHQKIREGETHGFNILDPTL